MVNICDADLHHLKPGKRVVLRLFNGSKIAPQTVSTAENYWQLIGKKADVVDADVVKQRALVKFDVSFNKLGLVNQNEIEDSLWVMIDDLKFVCRY